MSAKPLTIKRNSSFFISLVLGVGGTGLLAICDEPQILSSLSLNSIIHKGETMKENSLVKNHDKNELYLCVVTRTTQSLRIFM